MYRRNRIIRPLSEVARGGSTKTPRRSSQLSNLRQRIAEIRKFETFDKRAQKEGAGDPGNCKTTSAPGINFHNERAQCYAVWQSSSQTRPLSGISRQLPHPSLSRGAFAGLLWRFWGVESLSRGSLPLVGFSISSAISLGRFVVHHSLEWLDSRYHIQSARITTVHKVIVQTVDDKKARARNLFYTRT